ncbi:MAG TPA: hypothetical protein VFM68_01475 [Candidatus Saccharimonadales bacterium]|nr:hypothetical protein [Candidatus Saccharimonadales bacterium]
MSNEHTYSPLSYYPSSHENIQDADQRLLAERLAQRREAAVDDLGRVGMLFATGGVLETANTSRQETHESEPVVTDKVRDAFARTSLGELIARDDPRLTINEKSVLGHAA